MKKLHLILVILLGATTSVAAYSLDLPHDAVITITAESTKNELKGIIERLGKEGIQLKLKKTEYVDGKLRKVRGVVKSGNGKVRFSAESLNTITIRVSSLQLKVEVNESPQSIPAGR